MSLFFHTHSERIFHAPDHYGDSVKGGGHPADETVPAEEEIRDAMGNLVPTRGGVPGTNDPGVPGSRTERGKDKPLDDPSVLPHQHVMDSPTDKGKSGTSK